MHRFLGLIGRFGRDERGVFAVMFGLMAIVLIALGGAVVDYVSLEQTRNRAQIALDAAALALQPDMYDLSEAQLVVLAEALMVERIGRDNITANVIRAVKDEDLGSLYFEAEMTVPTIFVSLVGVDDLSARIESEATQGSTDLEVAVALDLSNSMNNSIPNGTGGTTTKIAALKTALNQMIELLVKDEQTPTYSKMALVPYSQAVNVGTYANAVRGAITPRTAITNVTWSTGTAKTVTAVTKANPMVITSNAHGFVNGDTVYVSGMSGTMAQLDNKIFTVSNVATNTFRLTVAGVAVNSTSYTAYSGNLGRVTKCVVATCELVVTSNAHGLTAGAFAYITGVGGMNSYANISTSYESYNNVATEARNTNGTFRADNVGYNWINNNPSDTDHRFLVWRVGAPVTTNTFVLPGTARTNGKTYGTYTSGGTVGCVLAGCAYQLFTNPYSSVALYGQNAPHTSQRRNAVSTCVTERDINTFTDASYLTTPVGRNYPSASNTCLSDIILPLSTTKGANIASNVNKATLHGVANSLTATGSTGGQVGVAWAWYLLSHTFNGPWPAASRPAPDDAVPDVAKAVVIMTDGEYNSIYKSGIIAQNSTSGSGDTYSMFGQNSSNGSSYQQTAQLCEAMKSAGITVYTVGLAIDDKPIAQQMMLNCASDPDKAYVAGTGRDLSEVFADIAGSLANLRITD